MEVTNYKAFWDRKATTTAGAMVAVDGSATEEVARLTGAYTARQVDHALALHSGDRVLELGCGVGRIGRELAGKVAHWEGVDISANMLQIARDRLADRSNVGLTELKRTSLDAFPSASFDKAYCVAVFIHMDKEDFFLYLEEIARILKPGGAFYFDTWNLSSAVGWRRFAMELTQYRNADPSQRKDVARNQFSTPQEVNVFLRHAGFETPLLTLDESPWVQTLATVPGGALDRTAERARLAAAAPRIAYTPLWTELFDQQIRIATEGLPPQVMVDALGDDTRGEEVAMFRVWFRELWRYNSEHWGPLPAELD